MTEHKVNYKYLYSVVRFVPSIVRGECVNLGILIFSEDFSDYKLRITDNLDRANALEEPFEVKVLPAVCSKLDSLKQDIASFDKTLLYQLVYDNKNALLFSQPLPILSNSINEALETLWFEFIEIRYLLDKRKAEKWFSALKTIHFYQFDDWKIQFQTGSEGYCWKDTKAIKIGTDISFSAAKRLIIHEMCHINTCLEEKNKHGQGWQELFAKTCKSLKIDPLTDGAYKFAVKEASEN